MRHVVLCGLSVSTVILHIISQKERFSKKKIVEHKMCFSIFSKHVSEIVFILTRIERDMIINVYQSSCEVPNIFVGF